MEISLGLLFPVSAGERAQLERRRAKLARVANTAAAASRAFAAVSTPDQLLIRRDFVFRQDPAAMVGDPSDRRLPDPSERPPATRLPSPRGIALQVYLTGLFLAQTRKVGQRPANSMPIDDPDKVSWIDLVATPAERGGRNTYTGVREKKLRSFQAALNRLAEPGVQLVELPNARARSKKYEGFLLLREGGAPYGGGDNAPYTVPNADEKTVIRVPAGLFHNGWIHVLEDRELTFLLMLADMQRRFPGQPVFIAGDIRLLHFGIGRDAYQSHHMLDRLGLVAVEEDDDRFYRGRAHGYSPEKAPKLHRFRLLDEGFNTPAVETLQATIDRRLAHADSAPDPTRAAAGRP